MNSVFKNLDRPEWALEPQFVADQCVEFIRNTVSAAGMNRLVVGLSGGIDSAVAVALAVKALGPDNVTGIMMPYTSSSKSSLTDAIAVAEVLGIVTEKVEIAPMADAFPADIASDANIRRGNIMARCRMVVLYDRSARDNALVLGTGNRTEALLGYTTLFGDSACALNPIGQLYKTEVRLLASWLNLPESVIIKAPSADLWEGQSDEDELGFTYAEVDHLMYHLYDQALGQKQLASIGFSTELIKKVSERVKAMAFKRSLAPVAAFAGRLDPGGKDLVAEAESGPDNSDNNPATDSFTDGGFH